MDEILVIAYFRVEKNIFFTKYISAETDNLNTEDILNSIVLDWYNSVNPLLNYRIIFLEDRLPVLIEGKDFFNKEKIFWGEDIYFYNKNNIFKIDYQIADGDGKKRTDEQFLIASNEFRNILKTLKTY